MCLQPFVYYFWHGTCGGFAMRGSFIHLLATPIELSNGVFALLGFVCVLVQA